VAAQANMISRREILIGSACAISAAAALALKPRRKVSLLPLGEKLSKIVPTSFEGWVSQDVSDQYAPEGEDSLLARLYGQTVGRIYRNPTSDLEVTMLMAHGESQSNELQVHRPEVCYPAFGFSIEDSIPTEITLMGDITLPGRQLIAQSDTEKQAVIYWTRLGEYFPVNITEQRLDRLDTAVHLYISDGLLARFSTSGSETELAFSTLKHFIAMLVAKVATSRRSALIGSVRASQLAAALDQLSQ
jgi:EpsI family protein